MGSLARLPDWTRQIGARLTSTSQSVEPSAPDLLVRITDKILILRHLTEQTRGNAVDDWSAETQKVKKSQSNVTQDLEEKIRSAQGINQSIEDTLQRAQKQNADLAHTPGNTQAAVERTESRLKQMRKAALLALHKVDQATAAHAEVKKAYEDAVHLGVT